MHLPFLVWTVVERLRRVLPTPQGYAPETAKPAQALAQIGLSEQTAVYLFKDLIAHLKDETVVRLHRDLAGRFTRDTRTIILVDAAVSLPAALRAWADGRCVPAD